MGFFLPPPRAYFFDLYLTRRFLRIIIGNQGLGPLGARGFFAADDAPDYRHHQLDPVVNADQTKERSNRESQKRQQLCMECRAKGIPGPHARQ
jgi:hypothetical protein